MATNRLLTGQVLAQELLYYLVRNCLPGILRNTGGIVRYVDDRQYGYKQGDEIFLPDRCTLDPDDFGSAIMPIMSRRTVLLEHRLKYTFEAPGDFLTWNLDQALDMLLAPMAVALGQGIESRWPPGAAMINASMELPQGVAFAAQCHDPDSGLNLLLIAAYDPTRGEYQLRADMLFGFDGAARYQLTRKDREVIAMLAGARAEYVTQLERLRRAA